MGYKLYCGQLQSVGKLERNFEEKSL